MLAAWRRPIRPQRPSGRGVPRRSPTMRWRTRAGPRGSCVRCSRTSSGLGHAATSPQRPRPSCSDANTDQPVTGLTCSGAAGSTTRLDRPAQVITPGTQPGSGVRTPPRCPPTPHRTGTCRPAVRCPSPSERPRRHQVVHRPLADWLHAGFPQCRRVSAGRACARSWTTGRTREPRAPSRR